MSKRARPLLAASALAASLLALAAPRRASAFCGFYVGGADAKLFNNATQVVLMREGARTVLSMANNYQGPPDDFAMVVPVPVILRKENVKTLKADVFDRIDKLTAPRLVEYWEQDPCAGDREYDGAVSMAPAMAAKSEGAAPGGAGRPLVKIEAEFTVGEYEVVILSAEDSMALDTWLRQNSYKIPEGAEPILKPYVQAGSKFFVAKVNSHKVTFDSKGMAQLSPLRFHYDDDRFNLPVRLGLLNSGGTQDLIVHVIGRRQRYELANYPNQFVPTNLDLSEDAAARFGPFYAELFDRTLEKHKGAVITEYSWSAGSCDPCPGPTLQQGDLISLGGDVIADQTDPGPGHGSPGGAAMPRPGAPLGGALPQPPGQPPTMRGANLPVWEFTITRLHARYTKETLGEDLVFRKAPPAEGGREHDRGPDGKLSQVAKVNPSGMDNFQARYAIRHPWRGEVTCTDPRYGLWGGNKTSSSGSVALTPRGQVKLSSMLAVDVPSLDLKGTPIEVSHRISPLAYVAFLRAPRAALLLGLLAGLASIAALSRRNRGASS